MTTINVNTINTKVINTVNTINNVQNNNVRNTHEQREDRHEENNTWFNYKYKIFKRESGLGLVPFFYVFKFRQ